MPPSTHAPHQAYADLCPTSPVTALWVRGARSDLFPVLCVLMREYCGIVWVAFREKWEGVLECGLFLSPM